MKSHCRPALFQFPALGIPVRLSMTFPKSRAQAYRSESSLQVRSRVRRLGEFDSDRRASAATISNDVRARPVQNCLNFFATPRRFAISGEDPRHSTLPSENESLLIPFPEYGFYWSANQQTIDGFLFESGTIGFTRKVHSIEGLLEVFGSMTERGADPRHKHFLLD